MTQPAFPQLPDPKSLLTGPATALANIERGFPIGAPPISIGQVLNQIASSIPIPGGGGLPISVPAFPLGRNSNILAALAPRTPMPPAPRGVQPSMLVPAGRTGIG